MAGAGKSGWRKRGGELQKRTCSHTPSLSLDYSSERKEVGHRSAADSRGTEADSRAQASAKMVMRAFNVSSVVRMGGAMPGGCTGIVDYAAFHAPGTFGCHHTGSFFKVALGWHDFSLDTDGAVLLFLSVELGAGQAPHKEAEAEAEPRREGHIAAGALSLAPR